MNRRDFFRRTAGAVVLATLAPFLAKPKPYVEFAFDSNAFARAMAPLDTELFRERYILPAVQHIANRIDTDVLDSIYGRNYQGISVVDGGGIRITHGL